MAEGTIMAGLGIALVWLGYSFGLYGYCLLKGYNVTPKQLFSANWPPGTNDALPSSGVKGLLIPNAPSDTTTKKGKAVNP